MRSGSRPATCRSCCRGPRAPRAPRGSRSGRAGARPWRPRSRSSRTDRGRGGSRPRRAEPRSRPHTRRKTLSSSAGLDCSVRKRVAEPVHRSQEARLARVVADRAADLRHEAGEARFRDERARPERVEQLRLRERARPPRGEKLEQRERVRRKGHDVRPAPDLAADRVKSALAEPDVHLLAPKKSPAKPKSTFKTPEPAGRDRQG